MFQPRIYTKNFLDHVVLVIYIDIVQTGKYKKKHI